MSKVMEMAVKQVSDVAQATPATKEARWKDTAKKLTVFTPKLLTALTVIFVVSMVLSTPTLASSPGGGFGDHGVAQFDAIIDFLMGWMVRVGIFVMLWGAVSFALAISNQSADSKINAIMLLVSGAIVIAVGVAGPAFMSTGV